MSLTEMTRIQRFRERKKLEGIQPISVYLSAETIAELDDIVRRGEAKNRSEAIEQIIKNRKG